MKWIRQKISHWQDEQQIKIIKYNLGPYKNVNQFEYEISKRGVIFNERTMHMEKINGKILFD